MASKRMFAMTIIDSDAFLEMPLSTQALYFHLSMRADDEGFINNPKKIQGIVGSSNDDLKLLIAKKFIIPFESGIVVIKHWFIHNYIRKDRLNETVYQEEKAMLNVKENSAYTLTDKCQADVRQMSGECQARLNKVSIDKVSTDKVCIDLFEQFWSAYPRKTAKANAEKAFHKIKLDDFDTIMTALEKQKQVWDDPKFIPHAATWLNGKRWEDEIVRSKPSKTKAAEIKYSYPQRKYAEGELDHIFKVERGDGE